MSARTGWYVTVVKLTQGVLEVCALNGEEARSEATE